MASIIRAKFRCLSIEQKWNGETFIKLGPVRRDDGKDPENRFFWKHTPSGEATLMFQKGKEPPFKAGDYYFLDMQTARDANRNIPAPWRINQIEQQDYGVTVGFYCTGDEDVGCVWSTLKMQLSGEATGAREALQPHGSHWHIRFTFAEPSDADAPVILAPGA